MTQLWALPECTQVIPSSDNTGLLFVWFDMNLEVEVNLVNAGPHRSVYGEITVRLPGNNAVISNARLELTSRNERMRLAHDLARTCDNAEDIIPWDDLLELVCERVIYAFRTCEPPVSLSQIPFETVTRYRLDPILIENLPTSIYALPGKGKTLVACLTAVLTQDGIADGELGWIPVQGNVLYLDYENDAATIRRRCSLIRNGLGITEPAGTADIKYQRMSRPLAESVSQVMNWLQNMEIELLIIDGVGYATGGDTQKEESTLAYWQALRTFNITSLGIDHLPKNSGNDDMPYGSMYKTAGMRSGFLLKQESWSPTEITVSLTHKKNNSGTLLSPFAIRFVFDTDAIHAHKADITEIPTMVTNAPLLDRVVALLADEIALTTAEIAAKLSANQESVRVMLSRDKSGRFLKDGKKWLLKEGSEQCKT